VRTLKSGIENDGATGVSYLNHLMSNDGPRRRFGTLPRILKDRTSVSECVSWGSTFQGLEYSVWAANRGRVLPRKRIPKHWFDVPKSSFGEQGTSNGS
jgi:hypothetical protein